MTEIYDFDAIHPRRDSNSFKWNLYDADVLPMWVADTDFLAPRPVIDALKARVEHGIFGYQFGNQGLAELLVERLHRLYGWTVAPDEIVFISTLVAGLNAAVNLYGMPGQQVLVQSPIYPPFLGAPKNFDQTIANAPLTLTQSGQRLHYEIDFDAFEAAITPQTGMFILCNPHNPVGRMYTRTELERLAEICLRHDLTIVSDDIHGDLILDSDRQHIPIATLGPEVAARTVTLMSPSKTFNLAGLQCGFAVVQDKARLDKMHAAMWSGTVPHVNVMGWTAAEAAYRYGQPYLDQLLPYLRANRDAVVNYVETHLPGVRVTVPQATFLAWLDLRDTPIADNPYKHLLDVGRVAPNDGKAFGPGGEGFIRLNFGCPRSVLLDGLDRIRKTLES